MPMVKYLSRATNEPIEVFSPLNDSVVEFTKEDGSKHQLMRSLFDGQYFAAELPKATLPPATSTENPLDVASLPGAVSAELTPDRPIASPVPEWFASFAGSLNARLDHIEDELEAILGAPKKGEFEFARALEGAVTQIRADVQERDTKLLEAFRAVKPATNG